MLRTQQAVTWKKRRQLATHVCKLRKIARMMKKRKFLSVRLASPKYRSRRTAMKVRKESQKESLQLPQHAHSSRHLPPLASTKCRSWMTVTAKRKRRVYQESLQLCRAPPQRQRFATPLRASTLTTWTELLTRRVALDCTARLDLQR